MGRYAKVTESKFKAVKILLASGSTHKECAESMGLSVCTVGVIKRSETYEEYKNITYMTSGYYRKKMMKEAEAIKEAEEEPVEEVVSDAPASSETKQEEIGLPAQVVEYRQNVTIQATHYMMEELRKTNELLTLISNKLAFIVEELTR